MAKRTQTRCEYCITLDNLALLGPLSSKFDTPEEFVEATESEGWFGPSLYHLELMSTSCNLCRAVNSVLQHSSVIEGSRSRRVVLRLVNEFGFMSDGETPWKDYALDLDARALAKRGTSAGIAALGVEVESEACPGKCSGISTYGLRVYAAPGQ